MSKTASKKSKWCFWIDDEELRQMMIQKKIKTGVPLKVQIEHALRLYLKD